MVNEQASYLQVSPVISEALREMSDDDLLALAQARDDAAFEEVMRRNSSSSLKLALSILKDRQEAEDAVQDSYLNVWRSVDRFQGESKISTWISRIVTNQCLMRLRKRRRAELVYIDDGAAGGEIGQIQVADGRPTPEADLRDQEAHVVLHQEVAKLPPLLREVLVLRDLREIPTLEVSERLGITLAAVKARLMRARVELRSRLETRQRMRLPARPEAPAC